MTVGISHLALVGVRESVSDSGMGMRTFMH